jgi:hypothetical protein
MRSRVTDINPTNRRSYVLRIRGKYKNQSIICAHAAMEEKSERKKDEFMTD